MDDFIEGAALFSDIFASSGMKVVLSGTDSLGFVFSEDQELYDRCFMLHTTFVPYREFENVLGIKGIDEYIRYGGTMSLGGVDYNQSGMTFATKESTTEYTDNFGKRQTVYAATLQELREKEAEIDEYAKSGVNYASGNITVVELLERYLALQQGRRYNTQVGYVFVLNLVKKEPFGQRIIRNIKASDAKLWFIKLSRDGRGFSTICSIRGVLKPAFQMAFEEDIIRKNPFLFKMDIIPNDTKKREAMTPQQQVDFMTFIRDDEHYCECYDEYVVLLETGVRISEFVGLTKNDLDFEKRRIHVDHQLVKRRTGEYYIEKTKTESGDRYIPMTDRCYESLRNILFNRPKPKMEMIVNGYTGFLFLDKKGKPKVALHFEHQMKRAVEKYNNTHDEPLPRITPHVFRHTFCTNMARAGMDVKSLQYLMGHSDVTVTLNVYTHMSYEHAAESMAKIIDLQNEVLKMCP